MKQQEPFLQQALGIIRGDPNMLSTEGEFDFQKLLIEAEEAITKEIAYQERESLWQAFQVLFHHITRSPDPSYNKKEKMWEDYPALAWTIANLNNPPSHRASFIHLSYESGVELIDTISKLPPKEREAYIEKKLVTYEVIQLRNWAHKLRYKYYESEDGSEEERELIRQGQQVQEAARRLPQKHPWLNHERQYGLDLAKAQIYSGYIEGNVDKKSGPGILMID